MREQLEANHILVEYASTREGATVTFLGDGPERVTRDGPDGAIAAALTRALVHTVTVDHNIRRRCDCGVAQYDCVFEWLVLHVD